MSRVKTPQTPLNDEEQKKMTFLFQELWPKHKALASKLAYQFYEPIVGMEFDDLMSEAQLVFIQVLRKHQSCRGRHITMFYTSLKNKFLDLRKTINKKSIWMISGYNPKTKRALTPKIVQGRMNLESEVQKLRGDGFSLRVQNTQPNYRKISPEMLSSIESFPTDSFLPENDCAPVSSEAIVKLIHHGIKDPKLKNLTLMLYRGDKFFGKGGIKEKTGLTYNKYQKELKKVQKVLDKVLA